MVIVNSKTGKQEFCTLRV